MDFQKCDKCDATFTDPDARARHLASKQAKNNEKVYCDLCPFKSCTMPSLKIHRENIHKETKNMIVCQFCNVKCKNKGDYLNHCKILHPKEAPAKPKFEIYI